MLNAPTVDARYKDTRYKNTLTKTSIFLVNLAVPNWFFWCVHQKYKNILAIFLILAGHERILIASVYCNLFYKYLKLYAI